MTEEELKILFGKLTDQYGIIPENSKRILVILVDTAIKYRDRLVKKGEPALTVEETKKALDVLMQAMQNNRTSETIPPRIKQLVTLWLDEVKCHVFH